MIDPQIALLAVLTTAIGYTMAYAGLKKNMLELKARKRTCPSCGRSFTGRSCTAH